MQLACRGLLRSLSRRAPCPRKRGAGSGRSSCRGTGAAAAACACSGGLRPCAAWRRRRRWRRCGATKVRPPQSSRGRCWRWRRCWRRCWCRRGCGCEDNTQCRCWRWCLCCCCRCCGLGAVGVVLVICRGNPFPSGGCRRRHGCRPCCILLVAASAASLLGGQLAELLVLVGSRFGCRPGRDGRWRW